jgi:hypothetical protein
MKVVTVLRKEATFTHRNTCGTEEAFKVPVLTRSSAFIKRMSTVNVNFRWTERAL